MLTERPRLSSTLPTALPHSAIATPVPCPVNSIRYNETAVLPETFDRESGPRPYARGLKAYRATVSTRHPDSSMVLRVGACSLWCAVYVDKVHLVSFNLGASASALACRAHKWMDSDFPICFNFMEFFSFGAKRIWFL